MGSGNLDEIRKTAKRYQERMAKAVFVDEGHIVIRIEVGDNGEHEYDIDLARCDTPEKILAWCEHLTEKTWMTPELMNRFIHVALSEHGLNLESI